MKGTLYIPKVDLISAALWLWKRSLGTGMIWERHVMPVWVWRMASRLNVQNRIESSSDQDRE